MTTASEAESSGRVGPSRLVRAAPPMSGAPGDAAPAEAAELTFAIVAVPELGVSPAALLAFAAERAGRSYAPAPEEGTDAIELPFEELSTAQVVRRVVKPLTAALTAARSCSYAQLLQSQARAGCERCLRARADAPGGCCRARATRLGGRTSAGLRCLFRTPGDTASRTSWPRCRRASEATPRPAYTFGSVRVLRSLCYHACEPSCDSAAPARRTRQLAARNGDAASGLVEHRLCNGDTRHRPHGSGIATVACACAAHALLVPVGNL